MLDGPVLATGRFSENVSIPAIAATATSRVVPLSTGALSSYNGLLVAFLVGFVLVLGGLAFFPALALCSLAGHLALGYGLFMGLAVGGALIVGGLALMPTFAWPEI